MKLTSPYAFLSPFTSPIVYETATNLNLPLLPSYLLIAAFLASFLKSSKDSSLFLRSNEGMAGNVKKGGGAKKSRKPGDGEEERDDLVSCRHCNFNIDIMTNSSTPVD